MTQTEHIKNYLTKNGLGQGCNDSLKRFQLETGQVVTYANFRRVFITFNEGANILQTGPLEDPRFKTIEHKDKHGFPFLTWESIPADEKPSHLHIGREVLICDLTLQPTTYTIIAFHNQGDKFWKEYAGFSVLEKSTGYTRCFHADSVRLIKGHSGVLKTK